MIKEFYYYLIILFSGLFDRTYYLLTYPDVRKADIDPLWHFVKCGWKEGRDPSNSFNTSFYLENNPDVANTGINPLIHYHKHGIKENRLIHESKSHNNINIFITRPKVSIIIPVYNAYEYTKNCIEHIYKYKYDVSFEVIVIDNASEPKTKIWLKQGLGIYPNFQCNFLETNIGFGPAVNIGIKQSSGEFIVILNSDTIPANNWLERLLEAFEADPSLGIISPVTNYVGEGSQVDPKAKDLKPDEIDRYERLISNRKKIIYEPSRLVFFCVMLPRIVIDKIGLLDETYIRGNFEDDDFCLRVRIAGFKLGVVQNAFVYHHGSATFKDNKLDYSEYFDENRKIFYLKAGRISAASPAFKHVLMQNAQPQISVIVRTVNRPDLLKYALNSLANQTYTDFEVVLVNDGGPDCNNIVIEYENTLNIKYVKHKNSKGRTSALNSGIKYSKGNWITILDDDDIYYPWHLETMYLSSENSQDARFLYGNYNRVLIDSDSSSLPIHIINQPHYNYSRETLLLLNRIPINTWFVNKKILDEIGYFDESFDTLEDYEFLLRSSEKYFLTPVNKVISEYRFYLSQSNSIVRLREDAFFALQKIYDLYPALDQKMEGERQYLIEILEQQVIELQELLVKLNEADDEDKKNIYMQMLSIAGAI